MSSEGEPLAAQEWLGGRGKRRAEAVDHAYGMLGLDYGKGYLDDLYLAAYEDALRDAYALTSRQAQEWFRDAHGRHDISFHGQHRQAREQSGG